MFSIIYFIPIAMAAIWSLFDEDGGQVYKSKKIEYKIDEWIKDMEEIEEKRNRRI